MRPGDAEGNVSVKPRERIASPFGKSRCFGKKSPDHHRTSAFALI